MGALDDLISSIRSGKAFGEPRSNTLRKKSGALNIKTAPVVESTIKESSKEVSGCSSGKGLASGHNTASLSGKDAKLNRAVEPLVSKNPPLPPSSPSKNPNLIAELKRSGSPEKLKPRPS